MTRIVEEVRPTSGDVYIQNDYSPGYDILIGNERVAEGTRIRVNPNASTGSHNLVSIDVNDKTVVDELNAKYPLAWPSMYPGTTYSFEDASGNSNALKLVKAVELWLYLNNFEVSNIDNLEATNVAPASSSRAPYSEYLDNKTPYRIPPETMWNREIFYNELGQRVDLNGNRILDVFVDSNGSPVFKTYDIGTQEEKDILALALEVSWLRGTLPNSIPTAWFTSSGELVKDINSFTPQELQLVRDSNVLFSPVETILPFSPFTLQGTRIVASKVAGSHSQKLYTTSYMAKTEYETTMTDPKTEYEWGGPYSTGRNTF